MEEEVSCGYGVWLSDCLAYSFFGSNTLTEMIPNSKSSSHPAGDMQWSKNSSPLSQQQKGHHHRCTHEKNPEKMNAFSSFTLYSLNSSDQQNAHMSHSSGKNTTNNVKADFLMDRYEKKKKIQSEGDNKKRWIRDLKLASIWKRVEEQREECVASRDSLLFQRLRMDPSWCRRRMSRRDGGGHMSESRVTTGQGDGSSSCSSDYPKSGGPIHSTTQDMTWLETKWSSDTSRTPLSLSVTSSSVSPPPSGTSSAVGHNVLNISLLKTPDARQSFAFPSLMDKEFYPPDGSHRNCGDFRRFLLSQYHQRSSPSTVWNERDAQTSRTDCAFITITWPLLRVWCDPRKGMVELLCDQVRTEGREMDSEMLHPQHAIGKPYFSSSSSSSSPAPGSFRSATSTSRLCRLEGVDPLTVISRMAMTKQMNETSEVMAPLPSSCPLSTSLPLSPHNGPPIPHPSSQEGAEEQENCPCDTGSALWLSPPFSSPPPPPPPSAPPISFSPSFMQPNYVRIRWDMGESTTIPSSGTLRGEARDRCNPPISVTADDSPCWAVSSSLPGAATASTPTAYITLIAVETLASRYELRRVGLQWYSALCAAALEGSLEIESDREGAKESLLGEKRIKPKEDSSPSVSFCSYNDAVDCCDRYGAMRSAVSSIQGKIAMSHCQPHQDCAYNKTTSSVKSHTNNNPHHGKNEAHSTDGRDNSDDEGDEEACCDLGKQKNPDEKRTSTESVISFCINAELWECDGDHDDDGGNEKSHTRDNDRNEVDEKENTKAKEVKKKEQDVSSFLRRVTPVEIPLPCFTKGRKELEKEEVKEEKKKDQDAHEKMGSDTRPFLLSPNLNSLTPSFSSCSSFSSSSRGWWWWWNVFALLEWVHQIWSPIVMFTIEVLHTLSTSTGDSPPSGLPSCFSSSEKACEGPYSISSECSAPRVKEEGQTPLLPAASSTCSSLLPCRTFTTSLQVIPSPQWFNSLLPWLPSFHFLRAPLGNSLGFPGLSPWWHTKVEDIATQKSVYSPLSVVSLFPIALIPREYHRYNNTSTIKIRLPARIDNSNSDNNVMPLHAPILPPPGRPFFVVLVFPPAIRRAWRAQGVKKENERSTEIHCPGRHGSPFGREENKEGGGGGGEEKHFSSSLEGDSCFALSSLSSLPSPSLPAALLCYPNTKGSMLFHYDYDAFLMIARAIQFLQMRIIVYDVDQRTVLIRAMQQWWEVMMRQKEEMKFHDPEHLNSLSAQSKSGVGEIERVKSSSTEWMWKIEGGWSTLEDALRRQTFVLEAALHKIHYISACLSRDNAQNLHKSGDAVLNNRECGTMPAVPSSSSSFPSHVQAFRPAAVAPPSLPLSSLAFTSVSSPLDQFSLRCAPELCGSSSSNSGEAGENAKRDDVMLSMMMKGKQQSPSSHSPEEKKKDSLTRVEEGELMKSKEGPAFHKVWLSDVLELMPVSVVTFSPRDVLVRQQLDCPSTSFPVVGPHFSPLFSGLSSVDVASTFSSKCVGATTGGKWGESSTEGPTMADTFAKRMLIKGDNQVEWEVHSTEVEQLQYTSRSSPPPPTSAEVYRPTALTATSLHPVALFRAGGFIVRNHPPMNFLHFMMESVLDNNVDYLEKIAAYLHSASLKAILRYQKLNTNPAKVIR